MKLQDTHLKVDLSPREIPRNVAYLNFSLIDELDYVIGGYGKPNQEFIFTLNSFIESYVLNDVFHFSFLEWSHFTNTNKITFNNGRPIYSILINEGDKILFRDWIGEFKGLVMLSEPVIKGKVENQFYIDKFQKEASDEVKDKYFRPVIFLNQDEKFPYLYRNFGFNKEPKESRYLILAIERSQKELLRGLYTGNSDINCHACMPFSGMNAQYSHNKALLPSNQSYKLLSKIYNQKIENLHTYSGYKKIPIPPLVSIVLSQCKDRSDIPSKLKQLRADFTELRNSFSELEDRIENADNIKQQIEAIEEIRKFWIAFSKKYENDNHRLIHHFWDIKKASKANDAFEGVLDSGDNFQEFLTNLNAIALVGKITEKTYSFFKDRKSLNRFQGIIDLWELSQKTPALKKQAKDYERIFNVQIDTKELDRLYKQAVF
ncbi:MAG: hypothetical protein Tsb004_05450 [Allomuricauda sp.]